MSAGGSDMPGGGCITAGEVRPGRGGGWGGKRRGLVVGRGAAPGAAPSSWQGHGTLPGVGGAPLFSSRRGAVGPPG